MIHMLILLTKQKIKSKSFKKDNKRFLICCNGWLKSQTNRKAFLKNNTN